jgi:hypothetical protein
MSNKKTPDYLSGVFAIVYFRRCLAISGFSCGLCFECFDR